jgi:hypothetical protein
MYIATSDTAYTGWQPVRIDAGYGGSSSRGDGDGFFTNSTGLQWSSNAVDSFGGWIICDWWHGTEPDLLHSTIRANHILVNAGVPQLFFRLSSYDLPLPASCADIYLRHEYI